MMITRTIPTNTTRDHRNSDTTSFLPTEYIYRVLKLLTIRELDERELILRKHCGIQGSA